MNELSSANETQRLLRAIPSENIDWNAVMERAQSHPEELVPEREDPYDYPTILHEMLPLDPPTEAVRAVIQANPRALGIMDPDWEFHCVFLLANEASEDILRVMLEEYRRNAANLELDTDTILEAVEFWGGRRFSPLLMEDTRIFLEELPIERMENMGWRQCNKWFLHLLNDRFMNLDDFFERLELVLRKITTGTASDENSEGRRFYVLHSFLRLLCKSWLFYERKHYIPDMTENYYEHNLVKIKRVLAMIKERYPEQFRTRDNEGCLPLHITATLTNERAEPEEDDEEQELDWLNLVEYSSQVDVRFESRRSRYERYLSVLHKFSSSIINLLIEEYPESVGMPDGEGRLPLHIAMEHGLPCWNVLVKAEPRVLETSDMTSRMYPFQTAALVSTDDALRNPLKNCESLNTVYKLLRQAPLVLESYRTPNDERLNSKEFAEEQLNKLELAQLHRKYKQEERRLQSRNKELKRKMDKEHGSCRKLSRFDLSGN